MAYPDLPAPMKSMLATPAVRWHHRLWHLVRNEEAWNRLPAATRQQLVDANWTAPRWEETGGAGTDFLGMHRMMIHMVDASLGTSNDASWERVTGWNPSHGQLRTPTGLCRVGHRCPMITLASPLRAMRYGPGGTTQLRGCRPSRRHSGIRRI